MTVRDYFQVLRRQWYVIVAGLVLGGMVAFVVTMMMTPIYKSQTRLFVSTPSGKTNTDLYQGDNFTQSRMQSYADLATSPQVLDPVIQKLGLNVNASALADQISAQAPANTVMLTISASDSDAGRAAGIANETAASLGRQIEQLEAPADGPSPIRAKVVQQAAPPSTPTSPDRNRNLALGLVLGGVLGLAVALLRQTDDTKVRTPDDVKSVTQATLLGAVPMDKGAGKLALPVRDDPRGPRAEALSRVRTNLAFLDVVNPPRSVLVTSCSPGEGKSSTVTNLAMLMAEAEQRVCIVEADLRRPKTLDYLDLDGGDGLTTVLAGEAALADVITRWGDIDVLPPGDLPMNPSELLGSQRMRQVLAELESRYDMVLIDAPPLLPVADAAALAPLAGGVVLVVGSGEVDARSLGRGLENLRTVGAQLLGIVVNRVPVNRQNRRLGYVEDGYGPNPGRHSRASLSGR